MFFKCLKRLCCVFKALICACVCALFAFSTFLSVCVSFSSAPAKGRGIASLQLDLRDLGSLRVSAFVSYRIVSL